MFVAIVVVPTPPFGLYTATVRGARPTRPSADRTGARSRERWNRSSSASTRASSSRASNGLAMTSSAPASRKRIRSSTSSLGLTHMTGSWPSDGVERIWLQNSIARRVLSGEIDDQELVLVRLRERLGRRHRPRDGVSGAAQDLGDRVVGRRIGLEQQDGTGGQGASAWVRRLCRRVFGIVSGGYNDDSSPADRVPSSC